MKTAKWFKIGMPLPIKDLAKKLQEHSFTQELKVGFVLKKVTGSEIIAQYIEQKTITKEITDPFGNHQIFKLPDFQTIEFRIVCIEEIWLLQVQNTPRTIKPLILKLSSIIGFGFYADNIEIDLSKLINMLEDTEGRLLITKMELCNINIQNIALGQMTITSPKDVRQSLDSYLLAGTDYKIKGLVAKFALHEVFTGTFEIRNNSRIEFCEAMPSRLFLEAYLPILTQLIK